MSTQGFGDVLKLKLPNLSHFSTVLVSDILAALVLSVIYFASGISVLQAGIAGTLSMLALVILFSWLSSRLIFRFSDEDAFDLAVFLFLLPYLFGLLFYALGAITGRPVGIPLTNVSSIAAGLLNSLVYYGAMFLVLGEKKAKKR